MEKGRRGDDDDGGDARDKRMTPLDTTIYSTRMRKKTPANKQKGNGRKGHTASSNRPQNMMDPLGGLVRESKLLPTSFIFPVDARKNI